MTLDGCVVDFALFISGCLTHTEVLRFHGGSAQDCSLCTSGVHSYYLTRKMILRLPQEKRYLRGKNLAGLSLAVMLLCYSVQRTPD